MKRTLLIFAALFASFSSFAQQPTLQNATFDKIARDGQSDCSCAGWTNKDLGDQPESSSWNSSTSFGIKFDDTEADAMYQEVAVLANTNYKFTFLYNFEDKGTDPLPSSLDVRILAGSGYIADYTPAYPVAFNWQSDGWGYNDIAVVENSDNNLTSTVIAYPGNSDFTTGELTFNTGANTSIVLFARGIGRDVPDTDGGSYAWSNGSSEIRIDEVTLVNTDDVSTSVNDVFAKNFSIYPNPSTSLINIKAINTIEKAEIHDLSGKVIISKTNLRNNSINISSLPKGIYVLTLVSGDVVGSTKIIKE